VSLRTTPTGMSVQFSPSELLKHPRTGSVRITHHILTTRTEPWGFIKLLALYQLVHVELSLHLSFYLRCNIGGYTVGTTMGFPVEIVKDLAPQSHCRMPQKCPQYHMRT
jgi:hypothetical protein